MVQKPSFTLPRNSGARVVEAQPLVGLERDELAAQVMRIRRADEANRTASTSRHARPQVKAEDIAWAESWNLPREVFDYFTLESPTA
jgi:hypothetical protein